MVILKSFNDKSFHSLLNESKAAALALLCVRVKLSFSLAMKDEKRLRTGLLTNSFAET
jgi:hypothetical protein